MAGQHGWDGEIAHVRNVAIVAHINAGKTTLTERILFDSGRQRYFGAVDSGTATMDWRPEEQERGISIQAAVTRVPWRDHLIQIVDTPGHVDFVAEVERSLRVVDAAIVVIDGVSGVEPQTETVWRRLDALDLPRLVFVNKLDRPVADLDRTLASIEGRFGVQCALLDLPRRDAAGRLVGAVDLLDPPPPGSADEPAWARARDALFERVADADESLVAAFVADRHPGAASLLDALRRATLDRRAVPVVCGSALHDVGVRRLLDAACRLLPSPRDRGLAELGPDRGRVCGDPAAGLAAFAFAPAPGDGADAQVLVRLFAGSLRPGDRCETARGESVRVLGIAAVHAAELEPIGLARAGEIVALETDPPVVPGDTLRWAGSDLVLEAMHCAAPILASTLEPEHSEHRDALEHAARAVASADPSLRISTDAELGALQVAGMGELHLDVFRERLSRVFRAGLRLGEPRVLRRKVLSTPAVAVAVVERLVAGRLVEARVEVALEPAPERGIVLRWAVSADADPRLTARREELLAELESVVRRGIGDPVPLDDVAIELRSVAAAAWGDGSTALLQDAIALACRRACGAAGPRTQEPQVRFTVEVPAESLGAVLAELRGRGAEIEGLDPRLGWTTVRGAVRLARIVGWATVLRSRTRGQGTFSLLPDGWIDVAVGGGSTPG